MQRYPFLRLAITPLVMGGFLISAVTGVLMFWHIDSGLNKVAHEWLSWAFLLGVGLHLGVHVKSVRRHLLGRLGQAVVGLFVGALALSFWPAAGPSEPGFAPPLHALAQAPLPMLAQVAGVDMPTLQARLQTAGLATAGVQPQSASLAGLVGTDLKAQVRALNAVLRPAPKS